MKISILKLYLSVLVYLVAFASCSKSGGTGNSISIVGTWTYAEIGSDQNGNNVIDPGETIPVGRIGAYGAATFTKDTYNFTFFDGLNPYEEKGSYTYANGTLLTNTNGLTPNNYNSGNEFLA